MKTNLIEDFTKAIKEWDICPNSRWEGDREAYKKDREDLNIILGLCQAGNYKVAFERVQSLDTVVRDQVPDSVWDFLLEEKGKSNQLKNERLN